MRNAASNESSKPKDQQTAYERWELSHFEENELSIGGAKTRQREGLAESKELSKIFETVRQEAYNKGMQEGFSVGMAKARQEAIIEKQNFTHLMQNFKHALELADEQIAEDVLSLALDIAKSMLKTKLNVDPAAVLPIVIDAIHYLPYVQKPARILVHHDDAQMIREYLGDEISSQHWQIQEDSSIERGGCLVETGANQIDASNEVRWKRISEALAQNNHWLQP